MRGDPGNEAKSWHNTCASPNSNSLYPQTYSLIVRTKAKFNSAPDFAARQNPEQNAKVWG